jgi:hypothetical protein
VVGRFAGEKTPSLFGDEDGGFAKHCRMQNGERSFPFKGKAGMGMGFNEAGNATHLHPNSATAPLVGGLDSVGATRALRNSAFIPSL